jgi:hypothetical protein
VAVELDAADWVAAGEGVAVGVPGSEPSAMSFSAPLYMSRVRNRFGPGSYSRKPMSIAQVVRPRRTERSFGTGNQRVTRPAVHQTSKVELPPHATEPTAPRTPHPSTAQMHARSRQSTPSMRDMRPEVDRRGAAEDVIPVVRRRRPGDGLDQSAAVVGHRQGRCPDRLRGDVACGVVDVVSLSPLSAPVLVTDLSFCAGV